MPSIFNCVSFSVFFSLSRDYLHKCRKAGGGGLGEAEVWKSEKDGHKA